jgi:hypothetical protein
MIPPATASPSDLRPLASALTVQVEDLLGEGDRQGFLSAFEATPIKGFRRSDFFPDQSNAQNYERFMPVGYLFASRCG